ncbi:MAG: BamA/TamA family outer membrane protein [bacterium]
MNWWSRSNWRHGRLWLLVGLSCLFGFFAPPPAGVRNGEKRLQFHRPVASAPDTSRFVPATPGSGLSYWGPIRTADPWNSQQFQPNRRPLWEQCFYYPLQVVALPFRAVTWGIGEAISYLPESQVVDRVLDVATLSWLPFEGSIGVSAGGGEGYGANFTGIRRDFLAPDNRLKLGLRYTTEENIKAVLGFVFNEDAVSSFSFGVGYRLKPNARFYGLGPLTAKDDMAYFTKETSWAGLDFRRELGRCFSLKLTGLYSTVGTRGPEADETPALATAYTGDARPFGYGDRSDGVGCTIALRHENTSDLGRPQSGGSRRLQATYFTARDGSETRFWTYRAEVQQFFPLWHTRRGLALRGVYSRQDSRGDDPIPFQRKLTNDRPDQFRGYRDLRFRATGLLLLSAEYRFPVWNYDTIDGFGLDGYTFVDLGQVFERPQEIATEYLTFSYGGGLRLVTTPRFTLRLEIGQSEDGPQIMLAGEQVFQYAKGGIYHGRNPVPPR